MNKNKKVIIAASVIIVLLAVIAYFFFPIKPLSSLNMTDIEEIQVFCAPPEQTVVLNQEEAAKVITLLQDTQVYQRGFVSTSTTGQVVKFTIIQLDGTETEILISGNTKISINGTSYRIKNTSTEALNSFANEVLK